MLLRQRNRSGMRNWTRIAVWLKIDFNFYISEMCFISQIRTIWPFFLILMSTLVTAELKIKENTSCLVLVFAYLLKWGVTHVKSEQTTTSKPLHTFKYIKYRLRKDVLLSKSIQGTNQSASLLAGWVEIRAHQCLVLVALSVLQWGQLATFARYLFLLFLLPAIKLCYLRPFA